MILRSRSGFTLLEMLVVLILSVLLFHVLARVAEVIGRVDDATRSGSDARALEATVDGVLRRALDGAGNGIPAAPNLSGVGVKHATGPAGVSLDTLVLLQGEGAAMVTASRSCPDASGDCIALLGDQRSRLRAGDLVLVGTRSTGLAVLQVGEAPTVFYAPCAADCPERLYCPVTTGAASSFPRIVGSIRQPSGSTSPGPCPQAFFPDGSRCEEVEQAVTAAGQQQPSCRVHAPATPFTAVRVTDRTTALGFPPPGVTLRRSGASASPKVRAVRVRASRFWVRTLAGSDTVLVRQNSLAPSGEWRTPVPVAGPVLGLHVETLHAGEWVRGTGSYDVVPSPGNPNYVANPAPAPSGREPAWRFLRGHHTIGAVRIRYTYRAASASQGTAIESHATLVVPTGSLLQGGTGDAN
jgi:prepilin-type N-terminal cleavage/methylation domain-containing protein